jgi:capsular polysaccharide biosynthesis protein
VEIRQLLKILLRWWWLALIPVIVVGGYTALTYRRPGTPYQVIMRFAAGSDPAETLSADYDRYYAWLSSEYIANALADIAMTGTFAENVATRLAAQGLVVDPHAIQGAIAGDNAQSVFIIYVTWPDAAQLPHVADAISAELTENGAAYFPQLRAPDSVARRVDPPRPTALPPSLRAQLLGPGLRLALAMAAGIGLVALAHYFDPMVRERAELEGLGVQVLSSIPKRRA